MSKDINLSNDVMIIRVGAEMDIIFLDFSKEKTLEIFITVITEVPVGYVWVFLCFNCIRLHAQHSFVIIQKVTQL